MATDTQPALPGMQTAAADAARSASRLRGSWTSAESAFAAACVDAWNVSFKSHGTRANRTKHNYFLAVQLLRWINGPLNDGERMTPGDVLLAISAYAADPWIREKCGGRYKSFTDWFRDCPDAVDKQLSRLGKRRGHAAKTPAQAASADRLTLARRMLDESGWSAVINQVAALRTHDGNPASLPEGLRIWRAQLARQTDLAAGSPRAEIMREDVRAIDQRLAAIEAYKRIPDETRWPIRDRAAAVLAPLPGGTYEAHIASGELFNSKSGTPGYRLSFKVCDGSHVGQATWCYLWSLADARRRCFPSLQRIADRIGCSRRYAQKAVRELIDRGYLTILRRGTNRGRNRANVYQIAVPRGEP